LQPKEFLQNLREITEQAGCALIFDEVVTGFRVHQGGAQGYFNIKADLATYGKVIGGGYPIGVIAGSKRFMDSLDGGMWQFGDNSFPEIGMTFFAGTFVRHPVALAATKAVLEHLKAKGPQLQENLNRRTDVMAKQLYSYIRENEIPIEFSHFSSYFYVSCHHDFPLASLLYYLLREKGYYVWEHRPCFLTTQHSDADIGGFVEAFKQSVEELHEVGLLSDSSSHTEQSNAGAKADVKSVEPKKPPVEGARLGRDPDGNPAWYVVDPDRPGKYLRVGDAL
jgi:glutamate-1-semialdehyde aminotransferase